MEPRVNKLLLGAWNRPEDQLIAHVKEPDTYGRCLSQCSTQIRVTLRQGWSQKLPRVTPDPKDADRMKIVDAYVA